ncbi:hypothetical protein GCM10009092_12260 [Bowmanella denitrificans]|uniref:Peptidoglycan-binding protein, CsiV n=1 Tax=Bowmanella denitrificans TaxID=366582 RepID=A0ABP3GM97_9ALTE
MLKRSAPLLGLTFALLSHTCQAQSTDWWFEVEVLLYKQGQALEALDERFPQPVKTPGSARAVDLLSPLLQPDISSLRAALALCSPSQTQPQDNVVVTDSTLLSEVQQLLGSLSDQLQSEEQAFLPQTGTELQAQIVGALNTAQPSPWRAEDFIDLYPLLRSGCQYSFEQAWLEDLVVSHPKAEPFVAQMPILPQGREKPYSDSPYLLPPDMLELRQLARDLYRQRGIEPLMHLAWRQNVQFGRSKARPYRLFAGRNFAKSYDINGYPLPEEKPLLAQQDSDTLATPLDLMAQVEQALAEPLVLDNQAEVVIQPGQRADALWELDGLFTLYLQYINRIPYLHIDADMVYRQEGRPGLMGTEPLTLALNGGQDIQPDDSAPQYQLYGLKFDQLRRIISKQIHYFDHPLFGMVVEVRRYHKPAPPKEEPAS